MKRNSRPPLVQSEAKGGGRTWQAESGAVIRDQGPGQSEQGTIDGHPLPDRSWPWATAPIKPPGSRAELRKVTARKRVRPGRLPAGAPLGPPSRLRGPRRRVVIGTRRADHYD